jgi:hypothetical protein
MSPSICCRSQKPVGSLAAALFSALPVGSVGSVVSAASRDASGLAWAIPVWAAGAWAIAGAETQAHAKAVQSAARRIDGERERSSVAAAGRTSSRQAHAGAERRIKGATFIESLVDVMCTALRITALNGGLSCACGHSFRENCGDGQDRTEARYVRQRDGARPHEYCGELTNRQIGANAFGCSLSNRTSFPQPFTRS